jgi:hypothetical protein
MILLRAVVLILTAILTITGLILAVVALLAAQWLGRRGGARRDGVRLGGSEGHCPDQCAVLRE